MLDSCTHDSKPASASRRRYYVPPFVAETSEDAGARTASSGVRFEPTMVSPDVVRAVGAEIVVEVSGAEVLLLDATESEKAEIEKRTHVRLFKNLTYEFAVASPLFSENEAVAASPSANLRGTNPYVFRIMDITGTAIRGARVEVYLKDTNTPAVGITDKNGMVSLSLRASSATEVHVHPNENYWSTYLVDVSSSTAARALTLEQIEVPYQDSLRHFCKPEGGLNGTGVRIAVIDSGINRHAELPDINKGLCIVDGKFSEDFLDNGMNHGTHVAGIIAGQGKGVRGIAPGVTLMSYRVFAKDSRKAQTLDITTAIQRAVDDGADIINLSLSLADDDKDEDGMRLAIDYAVDSGVLVVAAAGNHSCGEMRIPARYDDVVAVSALGLKDAHAPASTFALDLHHCINAEREFVPDFSNYCDTQLNLAAPGFAVVSTVELAGFRAMSGTSMATAVISGIAARFLSKHPDLVGFQRSPERMSKLKDLLYSSAVTLDLASRFVGHGLPQL